MEWLVSASHPWGGQEAGAVSLELGMKLPYFITHTWLNFAKFLCVKPRWLVYYLAFL